MPNYLKLGFIILLILAPTFFVFAQDNISVTAVYPGNVPGYSAATISINGSGFLPGAVVSLDGFGSLDSSYASSSTITAAVPGNVLPGTYAVRVTNPDGNWAILYNALTVEANAETPIPAVTLINSSNQDPVDRPIIVIDSYKTNKEVVLPGETFNLEVRLANRGRELATNVIIVFQADTLVPQQTGGVLAVKEIDPGGKEKLTQPLTARYELAGETLTTINVSITYGDLYGNSYTENFAIAIKIQQVYSGIVLTPTPTPTAEPKSIPQLVITDYTTDISPLQPGSNFMLNLKIRNLGAANALNTSMVVGGGTITNDPSATPGPGGISGGSADLTNFAPLGTSNVQFLGDIPIQAEVSADQSLIVNVSTTPGAYPLRISFIYTTPTGEQVVEDQVVTLLVYSLPVLDVNFYRDPNPIFAGQFNILPVQIVNLGKKSAVLGNLTITSDGADLTNNTVLIGTLDAGGYFTLDAEAIPYTSGPLNLEVKVDYSDDFNNSQVFSEVLTLDVQEMPIVEPPPEGLPGEDGSGIPPDGSNSGGEETLWQKIVRFFRGIFGLDSAPAQEEIPPTVIDGPVQ
jgi:hypothetical protein